MRKQAKLVAVLSAAALLAVGASMTSFAATPHWDMEDGEWVYLDRNGDKVTDVWKKSNGQWYYLDSDGFMAKDTVIEDDDDKYYVGEDGARVSNAWVSMDNDDLLDDDDELESIDTVWMYFGANGKALGAGSDQGEIKKLSYGDGQSGYFILNEDGYMLSGWKEWSKNDKLYYLGNQNEGWARTNWQYLQVDPDLDCFSGINEADEEFHDEEWFFFKADGKAVRDDTQKYNGRTYAFDQWGRMVDRWVYDSATNSNMTNEGGSSNKFGIATNSNALTGTPTSAAFYREEEGGRDKNWVLAYPKTSYDNYSDSEYWFYLDSKGRPFRAVDPRDYAEYEGKVWEGKPGTSDRIDDDNAEPTDVDNNTEAVAAKAIKSYTYLFNEQGVMLTGLFELKGVHKGTVDTPMDTGYYYFTIDGSHSSNEGKMVTNKKEKIDVHGDIETYYFGKDGKAFTNVIINGTVYGANGQLVNEYGDGSTYQRVDVDELTDGKPLTDKSGKKVLVPAGTEILINENGKIKQSGTTTDINDQKVSVSNYAVTIAKDKD